MTSQLPLGRRDADGAARGSGSRSWSQQLRFQHNEADRQFASISVLASGSAQCWPWALMEPTTTGG